MEKIEIEKGAEKTFLEKVAKLQKKIDIKLLNRSVEKKEKERTDLFGNKRIITWNVISYDVEFPEIYQIEGFEFLGGLTDSDGMVTWFSKGEGEANLHSEVDENMVFKCYHCNKTMQNRNNRLFFKKENEGIISFGVKCAENYFGIDVYKKLRSASFVWNSMVDEFGGGSFGYNFEEAHNNAVDFCLIWFGNNKGYVSQAKAESGGQGATSWEADYFCPPHSPTLRQRDLDEIHAFWDSNPYTPEEMDSLKKKIYKYYEEKEVKSDFDRNLKNLFEMRGAKIGLLVYGVYAYFKDIEKMEEEKRNPKFVPEWFEGEEVENMAVTFKDIKWFEGQFGATALVTLLSERNCFKWFTSSGKLDNFEKGKEYLLTKATVRKRDEFKGYKTTVIKTRFNWLKEVS